MIRIKRALISHKRQLCLRFILHMQNEDGIQSLSVQYNKVAFIYRRWQGLLVNFANFVIIVLYKSDSHICMRNSTEISLVKFIQHSST